MTNKSKPLFAAFLVGFLALAADASAAVPPRSPEEMMEEATHVVRGEVVALTSKTQKSKYGGGLVIARDRIFKVTLKLTAVDKGKDPLDLPSECAAPPAPPAPPAVPEAPPTPARAAPEVGNPEEAVVEDSCDAAEGPTSGAFEVDVSFDVQSLSWRPAVNLIT